MKFKKILGFVLSVLFSFVLVSSADAAVRLYFIPSASSVEIGDTFSVKVMVDTGAEDANALSAYFSYPSNLAQALDVDISNSALTLFAENGASGGEVRISGGKPNPGFKRANQVAEVSFRALAAGSVSLAFTGESAVLSNSNNQDILDSTSPTAISVTAASLPSPEAPVVEPSPTPSPTPVTSVNGASSESGQESTSESSDAATEEGGGFVDLGRQIYELRDSNLVSIPVGELPDTTSVVIGDETFQLILDKDGEGMLILFGDEVYRIEIGEVAEFSLGSYRVFASASDFDLQLSLDGEVLDRDLEGVAGEAAEGEDGGFGLGIFITIVAVLAVLVLAFVLFVSLKRKKDLAQKSAVVQAPSTPSADSVSNPSPSSNTPPDSIQQ